MRWAGRFGINKCNCVQCHNAIPFKFVFGYLNDFPAREIIFSGILPYFNKSVLLFIEVRFNPFVL